MTTEPKKSGETTDGFTAEQLQAAVDKALAEQKAETKKTEKAAAETSETSDTSETSETKSNVPGKVWKASSQDKKDALWRRWTAAGLWALAIGIEIWLIFFFLRDAVPFENKHLWILLGAIVVLAILSFTGSYLWKKANRFDPASEKDKFRFWVQNQLGLILAILAFLPLVIMILLNKNMDGKQKAIAGSLAALLGIGAAAYGTDFNPVSIEQYSQETGLVQALTGEDLVFWSSSSNSKIFHICDTGAGSGDQAYSYYRWAENAVADGNTIESGTVKDAHLAGKERLSKRWEGEATRCGIDADVVENAKAVAPIDVKYIEDAGTGSTDENG